MFIINKKVVVHEYGDVVRPFIDPQRNFTSSPLHRSNRVDILSNSRYLFRIPETISCVGRTILGKKDSLWRVVIYSNRINLDSGKRGM